VRGPLLDQRDVVAGAHEVGAQARPSNRINHSCSV
jgi:hypothetical protein